MSGPPTRIIVPHRGLAESKTRLASAVPDGERAQLVEEMLDRVLRAALAIADDVMVITPSVSLRHAVESRGARVLVQDGLGLNAALEQARHAAAGDRIELLGILPGDLPIIEADDVDALLQPLRAAPGMAVAPDMHGRGTNAMALRPMGTIPFRFGIGSFARHLAEARRVGIRPEVIRRSGLGFDLDTPADLARWRASAAVSA